MTDTKSSNCRCCQAGLPTDGPRICPECGWEFKGNGWDGIDAHWRAKHEAILPYEEFWGSLCERHGARRRHNPRLTLMDDGTSNLSARFSEAFVLALQLHGGQTRKRAKDERDRPGIPYIAHLMSVAALVIEHGGDGDEAIAALLHDGPEDQGGQETLDDIRRRFGDKVADIVEGCSDTFETPKPEWRTRKERYLDHLRETTNPSVFLVSVADKVHNLRSILADYRSLGDKLWERFTGKREGTLWYYGELLKTYQEKDPDRCADLVEEMERTYRELTASLLGEAAT